MLDILTHLVNNVGMKIKDYLKLSQKTRKELAEIVGTTKGQIDQLCFGRIPSRRFAINFEEKTNGAVTALELLDLK